MVADPYADGLNPSAGRKSELARSLRLGEAGIGFIQDKILDQDSFSHLDRHRLRLGDGHLRSFSASHQEGSEQETCNHKPEKDEEDYTLHEGRAELSLIAQGMIIRV